ncbi:MAG: hypothetical protein UX92_C0025G0011 [Candidatus Amesbacteria bacterium GW2011_GWA1_47_20]|uniref:Uncharacterized protein n=1 Tax=Candidatus Amesbacteria bacterium GW2011_GWA1_47_20 TaxID=1618354 RepID=A0A0G1SEZ6_9BACT|nr:MAG: hypothetical protein UX42_C0022G0012 [Microgenomates group bacterium GW2011_GWC1_46_20]KKU68007.1 MAG: hypothetical protein UX92_C0025G0011 [Candidatus Amesbacteria bacterium GW2011_GWA1_47_20]
MNFWTYLLFYLGEGTEFGREGAGGSVSVGSFDWIECGGSGRQGQKIIRPNLILRVGGGRMRVYGCSV